MTILSPERKLRYLSQYMEAFIDASPSRIKPFDRWLESTLAKRANKGNHEHKQRVMNICRYCRCHFEDNPLIKTKDHIIPISKGGFDKKENRTPCCWDCNQFKADKWPQVWLGELEHLLKNPKKIKPPYSPKVISLIIGQLRPIVKDINQNWKRMCQYKP